MQDVPLTLPLILRRAQTVSSVREVVTGLHQRATWAEVARRSLRVASVLDRLGVGRGERVGSFAWNTQRHVELYYGVPCSGRVLHTANVRLHHDQVAWLIAHADDKVLFVDASLTRLLEPIRDRLTSVGTFVVMEDTDEVAPSFADDPRYEELLAEASDVYELPDVAEDDAASICYTSGTTGNPKGVVYSHRSVVLHTLCTLLVDNHAISGDDTVLLVTPMFHVNGWGMPYATALAGSKLVLTGGETSPTHIAQLVERERATVSCAVPTVWARFIDVLDSGEYDLGSLRRILVGGATIADSLVERYAAHGVEVRRAWGMTEMSPSGTMTRGPKPALQGYVVPLVELRLCDEDGNEVPWDGESVGEIEARGPCVARAYYEPDDDANTAKFHDGWLRSGDVGSLTPDGALQLVDRTKDLVKSGGEWISSIELEERLVAHPDVVEAAVVARPDPEWDERPVAFVVLRPGATTTIDELVDFLRPQIARWWMPDAFELVDELPKTSVGKIDKRRLREQVAAAADAAQARRR